MKEYLDEKLLEYTKTDVYPFHMPGHKRQAFGSFNPYEIDITEIDGFDNLHGAQEILLEAQQRAAELYHAKESHYLINGSSCGLLAAIFAATNRGDKVLVARNCHKAVYHGILLRELRAKYIYPQDTSWGIQGAITGASVEQALEEQPDCKAVIITSPTYDGVVSDIKEIARVTHAKGIPLIVDEAHGAHFGFGYDFPENAGVLGADIVIMSMHKTLPSLTQTALLHRYSDRISSEKLHKYLGIFETSSPSYVFMAGMDRCIRFLEEDGHNAFSKYRQRIEEFHKKTAALKCLKVITREDFQGEEAFDFDMGKLLLFSRVVEYTGRNLYEELLEKYHLQMEMMAGYYVVAMTSLMDTDDGMRRLWEALLEIDERLWTREMGCKPQESQTDEKSVAKSTETCQIWKAGNHPYHPQRVEMTIAEAEVSDEVELPLEEAKGRISKAYIYLYPPGIPIIVPGERFEEQTIEDLLWCRERGLNLQGIKGNQWVKVVN